MRRHGTSSRLSGALGLVTASALAIALGPMASQHVVAAAPFPIDLITTTTANPIVAASVSVDGTTALVSDAVGGRSVIDIDAESTTAVPAGFSTVGADGDYYRVVDDLTIERRDSGTGALTQFSVPLTMGWVVSAPKTDAAGRYWLISANNGGFARVGAFVYDSVADELVTPEPGLGTGMNVIAYSLSADGGDAIVASFVAGAQPAEYLQVDLQTDQTVPVFTQPAEHDPNLGVYVFSPDFSQVLFPAAEAGVAPGLDATPRLYRRDLTTNTTTAVPVVLGDVVAGSYRIADDGRVLYQRIVGTQAFADAPQLFLWDGASTSMLTEGVDGEPADFGVDNLAEISDDGTRVTFTSYSSNLTNDPVTGDRTLFQVALPPVTPPPPPAVPPSIVPLTPARLLETRTGPTNTTIDGKFQGSGPTPAGHTIQLTIAGRGTVPANADAAMLNITAITPQGPGYLTVWPCGTTRPRASTLNYTAGQVVANAALAKIGTNGKVCIYTHATSHILADVTAYVPDGGSPTTVTPARLLETRTGPTNTTIDGKFQGSGPTPAGHTIQLTIAGRGTVPANADAAMLNITAITPQGPGYLTVWPCGTTRPRASTLNYTAGQVVANAALAKIGTNGKVCIYTHATSHILADVTAYVPDGGSPTTVTPARLLETRTGPTNTTIDGKFQGSGPTPAGHTIQLTIAGRGTVPANADAAMLNITAITPQGPGYLTVWPCGTTRPRASTLNYTAGQVVANAALAKIGTNGKVCIYTHATSHILADVTAYVADPG